MELLLLTADPDPASVLPALRLLPHRVGTAVPDRAAVPEAGPHDAVLVDRRTDLLGARALCRLLGSTDTGTAIPVIAVLTEGGRCSASTGWLWVHYAQSAAAAIIAAGIRVLTGRSGAASGESALLRSSTSTPPAMRQMPAATAR